MKLSQIAEIINATIEGDGECNITGPSRIEEAIPGTITFLGNQKYEPFIYNTKASAAIVPKDFKPRKPLSLNLLRVENVYEALGTLLQELDETLPLQEGISDTSVIGEDISFGDRVRIGDYVVIGDGASVGAGTFIHPQVYIGPGVKIGKDCKLYPGVKVMNRCEIGDGCVIHSNTVIGSDGFGFATDQSGNFKKIAQTGTVVLEELVEIGANCAIDRASIGETRIRRGAKIDNLVQVGHNVEIGENTAIAGQAGIAGSSKIGDRCLIGGQVGVVGHLKIHDGTQVQAQSGIAGSTKKEGGRLFGTPAIEYNQYLRSYVAFSNLPDYVKEIDRLKSRIERLEEQSKEK